MATKNNSEKKKKNTLIRFMSKLKLFVLIVRTAFTWIDDLSIGDRNRDATSNIYQSLMYRSRFIFPNAYKLYDAVKGLTSLGMAVSQLECFLISPPAQKSASTLQYSAFMYT